MSATGTVATTAEILTDTAYSRSWPAGSRGHCQSLCRLTSYGAAHGSLTPTRAPMKVRSPH